MVQKAIFPYSDSDSNSNSDSVSDSPSVGLIVPVLFAGGICVGRKMDAAERALCFLRVAVRLIRPVVRRFFICRSFAVVRPYCVYLIA